MGEIDLLLQDYSYLRSLEYKNQAPKSLSKSLTLPDPSVRFVVNKLFEETGECTFDRIFRRPIGLRVFQDFVNDPSYVAVDPAARLCVEFVSLMKELYSSTPEEAFRTASRVQKDYILNPVLKEKGILFEQDLIDKLVHKLDELQAKAEMPPSPVKEGAQTHRVVSIKGMFELFVPFVQEYLSKQPWLDFLASRYFVRYCQWKHLEMNQKVCEGDFQVHRILGRGGFGEVFGCRKLDTGAVFAMKVLEKKRLKLKGQENSALHERNVLAQMHSKFVTNLKYAFQDKLSLYLVLDLMEGGDLSFHLKKKKKFREDEAKFYAAEIILGLAHIHSRNYIYRDLKPANILLDEHGHARISDLGLARDVTKGLPTSECGTSGYMAPEVIKPNETYDFGADWWSLGCVVFQLFTGHIPFKNEDESVSREELDKRACEMDVSYPSDIPPLARSFISELLERDATKRLGSRGKGATEVRAHPWFEDMDWQAVLDHKASPPIRPVQGQVNAKDVYEIDRFDTAETRKISISPEDNHRYRHFEHIMSHEWQEEVLAMFEMITSKANQNEEKTTTRILRKSSVSDSDERKDDILQGYLSKLGGGLFKSFRVRYVHLFPDCLVMLLAPLQPTHRRIELIDIERVEERPHQGGDVIVLTTPSHGEIILRAEFSSDHKCWLECIENAVNKVKGLPPRPKEPKKSRHSSEHSSEAGEKSNERTNNQKSPPRLHHSTSASTDTL